MTQLEEPLRMARDAHDVQRDKAGASCVLPPIRVAVSRQGEAERTVALLHGVVEDSGITLDDLSRRDSVEEGDLTRLPKNIQSFQYLRRFA